MRVSQLLKELNIALATLRSYEPYVDFTFNVVDQSIPEEVYRKIIDVHNDKKIQQQLKKIVVFEENDTYRFNAKVKWYYNKQNKGEYGFLEKYGMPDIHFSGNVYLYKDPKHLEPGDEVIVTLNKKEVDNKKPNLKATSVNSISDETDLNYLLFHFLNHFKDRNNKNGRSVLNQISTLSKQSNEDHIKSIETFLTEKVKFQELEIDKFKLIEILIKIFNKDLNCVNKYLLQLSSDKIFNLWISDEELDIEYQLIKEDIINYIKSNLNKVQKIFDRLNSNQQTEIVDSILKSSDKSDFKEIYKLIIDYNLDVKLFYNKLSDLNSEEIFKIWLSIEGLEIEYHRIQENLIAHVKSHLNNAQHFLDRINNDQKKEILNLILFETCTINDASLYTCLILITRLYNLYEIPFNHEIIPEEQHLKMWENQLMSYFPFELVYSKLIILKIEYYNDTSFLGKPSEIIENYFENINDDNLKNILAKTTFDKDNIDEDETFKTNLFFIKHIQESDTKKAFIDTVYDKATNYYRLKLFIEDHTDAIDYNDVVIYTGVLSSNNQKLFFKKLIKLIAENKLDLSLEDLNRITTIDYQTSEYAKEIDGVGLDFTLSVLLKLITDLKNEQATSRTTIFDLIADQVRRPSDLLVIDGFFEKCTGRTIIEPDGTFEQEEGEVKALYKEIKKENYKPRFSTFCDGRKAVIRGTEIPSLCNKSEKEFWWCENKQCYNICRNIHTPSQWKNYSLEDILGVLKIPYKNAQYEILLNVINRVNRFLNHLTCRKCSSILKPKGQSNYAFYGVTLFSCQNNECEEFTVINPKYIYLSHCLNGKCEDIIDSRDSVKCKTHAYSDECGWYICKNCNACCSSEKLQRRKYILEQTGQEYKCHIDGHRDRGVICCSDCGNEMNEAIHSIDLYKKQLDWFIEQKDKNPNIIRAGQRQNDDKWWFIWARGNYTHTEYRRQLLGLLKCRFSIPDFSNLEKDNQLIAEPYENINLLNDKVFVCPKCDHHLDLNSKYEFHYPRKIAVQSFHNNIFTQIDN
jgi:hypothetical protein